jgi:PAS domain S-box-containing protein
MSDYRRLRQPLSERLPIVTYTNRFAPIAETLWMSPQVERISGYRLDQWVGRPGFFESVLHPDDREPVLAGMRESREDLRAFSRDYRMIAADGRTLWIHDESVPIVGDSGEPELVQGYFVDITERKELERQLLHAQKLEAVGRLTGGIAHDFNNFLMALAGYTELALQTVPPRSPARRHLAEVLRTVESARALSRQLLGFSRQEAFAPSLVDLTTVVDELRLLLRQVAGSAVRLDLDLRPSPPVYADPGELEQLLVNLVANARDAGSAAIAVRVTGDPRHAVITVADDGDGMDEDTAERAFDPFFTTKDQDAGTGLGLSIVHGIVSRAEGAIDLRSVPGHGTVVAIQLPAARLG